VLRWLAPLPILLALINGVGTPTLLVFGLDSLASRTALVSISINAVLTAALGGSLGAIGAALAADAAAGMTLLFLALSLRRERLAIWRQDSAAITAAEVSCPR
jgi:O-antigen/teichoic acid export membrane protein